jgi:hypothetical protein
MSERSAVAPHARHATHRIAVRLPVIGGTGLRGTARPRRSSHALRSAYRSALRVHVQGLRASVFGAAMNFLSESTSVRAQLGPQFGPLDYHTKPP